MDELYRLCLAAYNSWPDIFMAAGNLYFAYWLSPMFYNKAKPLPSSSAWISAGYFVGIAPLIAKHLLLTAVSQGVLSLVWFVFVLQQWWHRRRSALEPAIAAEASDAAPT